MVSITIMFIFLLHSSTVETAENAVNLAGLTNGKNFKDCLVHIVLQPHKDFELNYYTFSSSIVIHVDTSGVVRNRSNVSGNNRKMHDQKWGPSDRLQYLKCILTLVVVDQLPGSLVPLKSDLFLQKSVFNHNSAAHSVLVPSYFVLVSLKSLDGLRESIKSAIQDFTSRLRHRYFHLVFWLPLTAVDHETRATGWFYCSYCSRHRKYTPFDCPKLSSCSESMIAAHESATEGGKGVQWRLSADNSDTLLRLMTLSACRPTLKLSSLCVHSEPDIVLHFLFQGLNKAERDSNRSGYDDDGNYPVVWHEESIGYITTATYFLPTGKRYQFRFITTHGIAHSGMSLVVLLSPFDAKIWLALGITVVVISFALAGLGDGGMVLTCLANIQWLTTMCIDQPSVHKVFRRVSSTKAAAAMMVGWLILAIVMVTCYKAKIKSTYMLEPSYETSLKYLRDLKGFKLFFMYKYLSFSSCGFLKFVKDHVADCQRRNARNPKKHKLHELDCEAVVGSWICPDWSLSVKQVSVCSAIKSYTKTDRLMTEVCGYNVCSQRYSRWLGRYHKLLQKLLRHARVRDPSLLTEVVVNELIEPNTALVIAHDELESTWKKVKHIMVHTGLKFAHNRDTLVDDLLSISPHYKISSGFVSVAGHKNIFVCRAKMLMESGMYRFWERWEKLRRVWAQRTVEYPNFMALSLRNSDVAVVFHLYLYFISFSGIGILGEVAYKHYAGARSPL